MRTKFYIETVDNELIPAPDGDYELTDGTILKVMPTPMRNKFYILYYFLIAATLTMFVIIMKRHEKRKKAQTKEVYHYEEPRDWNEETLRGNKRDIYEQLIKEK